jgi:monoamine oxidase
MATVEPLVNDVLIVGAGLCGLALAHSLLARGLTVQVLEARERPGGRVLTATAPGTGQALDLGPTWFWPDTEPRMVALLNSLGLASVPQHDPGDALWLIDPNRSPERRQEAGGVHAGARRIAGGTGRLVQALVDRLPAGCLRTGAAVQTVRDRGTVVELLLAHGPVLRARHAVLALPPRLVQERVGFEPALSTGLQAALQATPTWMAAQAKALTAFARPFWREAGHSGNAFVRHPQAVLGEVFDACEAGAGAALGGFVALSAGQRLSFQRGLPLLIESQLAQLYGPEAQTGEGLLQDWAQEPWTCSLADRTGPPEAPQADPLLRRGHWDGRLWFGGSETAAHGAGHMEGALESADRLAHALVHALAHAVSPEPPRPVAARSANGREQALQQFADQVQALRAQAPERYRQHLTRLLAGQQHEQLTQRALLAAAGQVYSETLALLDRLLPDLADEAAAVQQGRHALTAPLLVAFEGWNKALLDAALVHNGTSCALSNFPQDHRPDADLLRAITLDLAAAWREFALELNDRLLARCAAPVV